MSLVGEYFFSIVNNHIHVYLFPVFFYILQGEEKIFWDVMEQNPQMTRLVKPSLYQRHQESTGTNLP